MKKNLALILALVMLMGTVFSMIPAAAAEATASASYEPKVSYANVNYSDKLYMMFAVPAPASLNSGDSVKLLVWANKGLSESYSFNDLNKTLINAEPARSTVNGEECLVYKYDGLTPADMTNIIMVRPVVVNTSGDVTTVVNYGEVIEYSVLEYVATAKGEFEGATALSKDVIKMLDSMLAFGSLAQTYSGSEYEFLANDELGKIWYTPVINGVEGEKLFGGFFKKGTDLVTVSAPHYDNYSFASYIDGEGNKLYDIDGLVDNGDQVLAPAEGDLEIKASYDLLYMAKSDPNSATLMSTNLYDHGSGNKYLGTQGGLGFNASASNKDPVELGYAALDVVEDPYQPGNMVHRISATNAYSIGMGNSTNDWKFSMKPSAVAGFGDTVDPVVSIDISIARGPNGKILSTNHIRIRSGSVSGNRTNIGCFNEDGSFRLYTSVDASEYVTLPTKVSETGYTRYVLIIDFANEVIYAYAAQNADTDPLVYQAETKITYHDGIHLQAETWMDIAATLDRMEIVGSSYTYFTDEELATLLADLDGDGVGETPMIKDGVANKEAIRWCANEYRSFYIKSYSTYVGSPVETPPARKAYTATPNKAQVGSSVGGWMTSNNTFTWNADAGIGVLPSKTEVGNYWSAKIVEDPFGAGQKVISLAGNANTLSTFLAGSDVNSYKVSASIATHVKTFGVDTYPMFTLDVTLGGNGADRVLKTGALTFRSYAKDDFYLNLGYVDSDGTFYVYSMAKDAEGNAVGFNTKASFKINLNGYTRIAFQFDVAGEELQVYAEQAGQMTLITTLASDELCFSYGESKYYGFNVKSYTKIGATWADWVQKAERIEWINDMTGGNVLTETDIAFAVDVDGDGVADRAFNDDGTVANKAAAEIFFHTNRALLIKDLRMYVGMYER